MNNLVTQRPRPTFGCAFRCLMQAQHAAEGARRCRLAADRTAEAVRKELVALPAELSGIKATLDNGARGLGTSSLSAILRTVRDATRLLECDTGISLPVDARGCAPPWRK